MTKVRILFFLFICLFSIIILRLFYIQIINPINTSDYLKTKKIYPQRGRIFDRNMLPLVTNQLKYRLFMEPQKVENEYNTFKTIAPILEMDEASIAARYDKTKSWVSIKSGLSKKQVEELKLTKLIGMGYDEEQTRFYPEGSSSAHILGFVGKNSESDSIGYFGIEGFYDKDLSGLPGLIRSDRDLLNQPIFLGTQEKTEPENGRDIVLTIDRSAQNIVKKQLKEGIDLYKAKKGCVIVADPKTMEILSLSCLPDFNPDIFYTFSEETFKNSAISDLYEPGSTFKPLIMAAALQNKAVKLNSIYDESGPITIGEYTIQTWNNSYEGKITMTRILEKSSNVGMVYIGEKMGKKLVYDSIKKYHFGEKTNIDLQGEVPGYIKEFAQWYSIDFATATFGQGLGVTPIQMIRAFSSLINGGYLMQPYIVKQFISDKQKVDINPKVIARILSQETSELLKDMLYSTIENGETKRLKPVGYSIGGKTGTAQIALKGRYDTSNTIASFIGFAPVNNPKFIALVILYEPKSSQWGSETAAPLFFNIAKELIVYYNIPPE